MDEDIHRKFLMAVHVVGLKNCIPTSLLSIMKQQMDMPFVCHSDDSDSTTISGLSTEHLKSHLQKYRQRASRSAEFFIDLLEGVIATPTPVNPMTKYPFDACQLESQLESFPNPPPPSSLPPPALLDPGGKLHLRPPPAFHQTKRLKIPSARFLTHQKIEGVAPYCVSTPVPISATSTQQQQLFQQPPLQQPQLQQPQLQSPEPLPLKHDVASALDTTISCGIDAELQHYLTEFLPDDPDFFPLAHLLSF
jgi:hypothetical protein